MPTASEDDELLSMLLVNLRNAISTFGEGSPPCEAIRTTVEEHVQAMKARGSNTNITAFRNEQQSAQPAKAESQTSMFGNLAFRPKPS